MFHNNIVKILETLNKRKLFKNLSPSLQDFCIISFHFYYGKKWNILFIYLFVYFLFSLTDD